MGFYTTNKIISQIFFYFYLGEGGPPAHKHRLKKINYLFDKLWDIMLQII